MTLFIFNTFNIELLILISQIWFFQVQKPKITAGASSMTFWCRLWMEQSLSNRYTALPCVSANTCTSTCLGSATYCSKSTMESPKDFCDSVRADSNAWKNSSSFHAILIPFPPPPRTAFIISGKPIFFASIIKVSFVWSSLWYPVLEYGSEVKGIKR